MHEDPKNQNPDQNPEEEVRPEQEPKEEPVSENESKLDDAGESMVEESQKEETPVPLLETDDLSEGESESEEEEPEEDEEYVDTGVAETAELASAEEEVPDEEAVSKEIAEMILQDNENFETTVEQASAEEMIFLLKAITREENIGPLIPKVGMIKRAFDKRKDGEEKPSADVESRFSTALARFNKKRASFESQMEEEKQANSKKKFELLDRLKEIVEAEKVTAIDEVRDIQKEWKETGWVLRQDLVPLRKTYKHLLDLFYNMRGMYNELKDQDRKYNLEQKQEIMGEVEKLIPADTADITIEGWKEKSEKLKKLQEDWKTVGHVPRENAEEMNQSYKNLLDRFYSMRAEYYDSQDDLRKENEEKKQQLLKKLEKYTSFAGDKAKHWNSATKTVLSMQEKWKEIGPATRENNNALWKKYREYCDQFFKLKSDFFKDFDTQRKDNLDRKMKIVERAEELQESEDWGKTADELKKLQQEWKDVGPVHERYSNKIWKRFRKACDTFFNRMSEEKSGEEKGQVENLKKKEEIIEQMNALAASDASEAEVKQKFKELQEQWFSIGHVPYKHLSRINKQYTKATQQVVRETELEEADARVLKFKGKIEAFDSADAKEKAVDSEIRYLKSQIYKEKEDVKSYEININYIAKGKSGDTLRKQIQDKIDDAYEKIDEYEARIKKLKKMLREGFEEENPEPEQDEKPEAKTEETPEESPKAETPAEDSAEAETPGEENAGEPKEEIRE